ncbi:MAG: hypothetical protein ABI644_03750 [Arenimonas sp.]
MSARLKPMAVVGACLLALSACDSKQAPVEIVAEKSKPAEQVTAVVTPQATMATENFLLEAAVKENDTLESLRKQYGEANVIKSELPGAEGETSQGWMLFPNEPEKKLLIYLDQSNSHPGSIVANELNSKWHLSNSIKMGTDSKALQALNQKPFSFFGFYWDYGGVISDWNGGALDKKAADGSHISIHLCPPENTKLPDNYLSGDGTFQSDNALAQKFPPLVCELSLSFPQSEE